MVCIACLTMLRFSFERHVDGGPIPTRLPLGMIAGKRLNGFLTWSRSSAASAELGCTLSSVRARTCPTGHERRPAAHGPPPRCRPARTPRTPAPMPGARAAPIRMPRPPAPTSRRPGDLEPPPSPRRHELSRGPRAALGTPSSGAPPDQENRPPPTIANPHPPTCRCW